MDVKHKVFSIKRAKIAKHNKEIKPTAENTLSKQLNQRFQDGLAINTGFQGIFLLNQIDSFFTLVFFSFHFR